MERTLTFRDKDLVEAINFQMSGQPQALRAALTDGYEFMHTEYDSDEGAMDREADRMTESRVTDYETRNEFEASFKNANLHRMGSQIAQNYQVHPEADSALLARRVFVYRKDAEGQGYYELSVPDTLKVCKVQPGAPGTLKLEGILEAEKEFPVNLETLRDAAGVHRTLMYTMDVKEPSAPTPAAEPEQKMRSYSSPF